MANLPKTARTALIQKGTSLVQNQLSEAPSVSAALAWAMWTKSGSFSIALKKSGY
jgi:hypothetical protein